MRDDQSCKESVLVAEAAMDVIKAFGLTATPAHYEVLYLWMSGGSPTLKEILERKLASNQGISDADLDRLHSSFILTPGLEERMTAVASEMANEAKQLVKEIMTGADCIGERTNRLFLNHAEATGATDEDAVHAVVDALVDASKEIGDSNSELRMQLQLSVFELDKLSVDLAAAREQAFTDQVTGLYTRRYFDGALDAASAAADTAASPLSVLLIDVDHFKGFNDKYGHLAGDQVLRVVAQTIKKNTKGRDIAARFGGEEFAVILPETAGGDALTLADNIRRSIERIELFSRSTGAFLNRVTVSIGVASLERGETPESCVQRADESLYAAKRAGRNRVHSPVRRAAFPSGKEKSRLQCA
jgi:diguanylate cyclase